MKKITILLSSLISFLTYSQDGFNQTPKYYNEIEKKVNNIEINYFGINKDYSFISIDEDTNRYVIVYQLNEETKYKMKGYDNLTFYYDLDFKLKKINGNFESLLNIWQEGFMKNATKGQIKENYKYRILKGEKVFFQFGKSLNNWEIRNRAK